MRPKRTFLLVLTSFYFILPTSAQSANPAVVAVFMYHVASYVFDPNELEDGTTIPIAEWHKLHSDYYDLLEENAVELPETVIELDESGSPEDTPQSE